MTALTSALVLATEGGLPYDGLAARSAVPLGILVFLGGPYLLLRSNLGTRRAYLVLATSFFGFMMILSLFWAFGAPGTPAFTGPTNLPGQVADEYRPIWVPFAEDSNLAAQEPYASLVADPGAFSEDIPSGQQEIVDGGVDTIKTFFGEPQAGDIIGDLWVVADGPYYAVADNGQPVIRVTYGPTYQPNQQGELPEGVDEDQEGELIPEGEQGGDRFTAYAFFDAGNPIFPSLIFIGTSVVAFALHALLLHADEQRERREAREAAAATAEEERVPAGV